LNKRGQVAIGTAAANVPTRPQTVVAAGILRRDGLILICQRRAAQDHALKWEFPGGKLEPGETVVEALTRELREELNIEAAPARELARYEFAYPGKRAILLVFLEVPSWQGEMENRIFRRMEWVPVRALAGYDFLEGDVDFLRWLNARES
jgi:8-oxo-dGTP diphosphatase